MKTNLAAVIDGPLPVSPCHLAACTYHSVPMTKEILKNILLFSESRIINKPILPWANELIASLGDLMTQRDKRGNAASIAKIYNQAAHIFLALDDIRSARELCYSQIQLFIGWSQKSGNYALLKHIVEPWVNLSCMDRLEGNSGDAFNKLALLSIQDESPMREGHPLKQLLRDIIKADENIHHFVKSACLLEPVKYYLIHKQYEALITFVEAKQETESMEYDLPLQEALIVSLANTGKMNRAFDLLNHCRSSYSRSASAVFVLRECEMNVYLNKPVFAELQALYKRAFRSFHLGYLNTAKILHAMHTAHVIHQAGLSEMAAKLGYCCVEAAERINDECLKAESLVLLYELIDQTEGRQIVEDLMIEHYFTTRYAAARKHMINVFPDLRHVESRREEVDALPALFEELLMFSAYAFC